MNSKNLSLIVILGGLLLFGGCACNGYNGLITQDENVKKAWNNVNSAYQERSDLIPNLVETVKGAANFEQETLVRLVEARSKATSVNINADNLTPEKIAEYQQAQAAVSTGIGRLLAVVENYPDIKANANFQQLQRTLEEKENGIRNYRNQFNQAVNEYNVAVRRFPMNLLAGAFGFRAKDGFQADPGAERAPEVKF
ncbi:MAG TPA: LemA family protein [Phnomibacter sp.]|nr:LemA family protein [Phnomibacter sp.]